MPSSTAKASALAVLALLTAPVIGHTWIEQATVISPNGSFTGQPGYARNNTMRTAPGFSDLLMVHILPGQGQPSIEQRQAPSPNDVQNILPTDPMCKKTQQSQFQSAGSPRLKAAPGDMVALRYEENGHVTLPDNQKGKPANRGTVYIYGTTQPKQDETFLSIFGVWNADGTGGDKRGKLLATQPFDDGQCYQVNSGTISAQRQKQFPHAASQLTGTDLWCQSDIKVPTDAPSGKPYTIYWVWDWPTLPNVDPNLPKGKAEVYTTCMDIDVTGTKATRDLEDGQDLEERDAPSGNLNNAAIPAYVSSLKAAPSAPAAATSASPKAATPANLAVAPVGSSPAAASPVTSAAPVAAAASAPANSPSVITVTVTAPAQPTTMATKASPAVAPAASSQAAALPAANSMPPAPNSLQIAAPVVSAPASLPTFSGTAVAVTSSGTAVAVTSSAMPSSAMPTYPVPSNATIPVAARQCNKCKKQKRSLILGAVSK